MSGQRKANRADGHLGQQSAGRDLGVSTGQVLGAGGDRGVRGEARLGLTVLLLFLVVVLVVRAVGVVAVRVLTVSAAHLTAVSRVLCVLVLDETRGDPHLQAFLTVGLGFHVFGQIPFSLEGEVAVDAVVRPDVRVSADVFTEHARLLTADPTLFTDVFTPASTSDVHVLFIRLVPPIEYFDASRFCFCCRVFVRLEAGLNFRLWFIS